MHGNLIVLAEKSHPSVIITKYVQRDQTGRLFIAEQSQFGGVITKYDE